MLFNCKPFKLETNYKLTITKLTSTFHDLIPDACKHCQADKKSRSVLINPIMS